MISGWLEFTLATSLLGLLIFLFVNRFADEPGPAFFIAAGLVGLDFGMIAAITSFFHALTPPGWLFTQAIVTGLAFLVLSRIKPHDKLRASLSRGIGALKKDRIAMLGIALLLFIVSVSLIDQMRTPISGWDDTTYVGARVGYWLQHHDVFRYRNNNDRQVVFPFGSELLLLFGLLFTRVEWVARLMIWFAYPASIVAVFFLLRLITASYRAATWGALLFAAAPQVLSASNCIKPELWSTVCALGAVYFCAYSRTTSERPHFAVFLAGIFSALALTAKLTMLCLVPALLITTCIDGQKLRRFVVVTSGYIMGVIGGGGIVTFYQNFQYDGHPFGPAKMRAVHSAEPGLSQIWIHSVRFITKLIDFPILPWKSWQNALNSAIHAFIEYTGASHLLRWENPTSWPGVFQYEAGTTAKAFSLIGILWIPVLVVQLWRMLRSLMHSRSFKLEGVIAIFGATTLAAILYGVRWQEMADVPFRFLLPSYAMGLALVIAATERFVTKHPKRFYWIATAAIFMIAPTIYECVTLKDLNEAPHLWPSPYAQVAAQLPVSSRIVHIGDQMTPEYYLFDPPRGYRNSLFAWGKDRFNAAAMRTLIDSVHPTHVLLDNDDRGLYFHWDPGVDTRPFANWLEQQPDLHEIQAPQPHMRLFQIDSDYTSLSQAIYNPCTLAYNRISLPRRKIQ